MKRALVLALLCAACAHSPSSQRPPAAQPVATPARRPAAPPRVATPSDLSGPAFPPEDPPPSPDPFAALRQSVDALLRAQGEALWAAWTRGERVDLGSTYAGHERIFEAGTVREVRDAARRATGDEARALALLHGFLVGEHLERETRESATRVARARASATIAWGGQVIPSDRVPGLLVAEPDAARRATLHRLQAEALARWEPAASEHAARLDAAARRLGHESITALGAELRGATREELAAFADHVLATTDAAYHDAMDSLARAEVGRPLAEIRGSDVPRLFRSAQDPRLFPAARQIPDVRALFSGLRLDLTSRPGAVLDLEARPRKDPRPLALPVAVPGDVRLSAVPGGGSADLRALLHETALASYFSRIESPRVEFRRLGNTTGETWALLFEELAGDPAWLLLQTGDTEHHLVPVVRSAAARRLHGAREAAARLLLELRRPASAAEAPRVATGILERAFARPVSPDEVAIALAERDPLLQSAVTLRAAVLAAQGESFLAAGAGETWWKDDRVGAFLGRAFAAGSRPDAAALAASFGSARLDASALAIRSRERIRWAEAH
ncbi:MAG TPA: hypothetical protein VFK85_02110 [Anaeromyxobacteraceae bacterium]|nr:hypothetical protein [Anaeromyxobacteraceae bacterium]